MGRIRLETSIRAPIERCFDLSRSVDAHIRSTATTRERAVAGVTSGLLRLGDRVTWEATHFGIRQRLEVEITAMHAPESFTDVQVAGIFARFSHAHHFESVQGGTVMQDDLEFTCPLGFFGRLIADRLVTAHLTRFLKQRNLEIKTMAESDHWRTFLPSEGNG